MHNYASPSDSDIPDPDCCNPILLLTRDTNANDLLQGSRRYLEQASMPLINIQCQKPKYSDQNFTLNYLSITVVIANLVIDLPLTVCGSERISRTIGRIPAAALSKLKAPTAPKLALPCPIDRLVRTSHVTCLN